MVENEDDVRLSDVTAKNTLKMPIFLTTKQLASNFIT